MMKTPRPTIKAVVFDAVGTVLFPEPSVAEVYAAIASRHGDPKVERDQLIGRFRDILRVEDEIDRRNGWVTSEAREFERWRRVVAHSLRGSKDVESCFQDLFEHFARPDAWKVPPEAAAVIERISRLGLPVAIASNFDSRLRSVVAGKPELVTTATLVISSEVGHRKPGPEFFDAMRDRLGLDEREILFVGDDYANDFVPAHTRGMTAVLLVPATLRPELRERVTSLEGLGLWLGW